MGDVGWKWFEREYASARPREHGGQKRVEANMCTNVEHNQSCTELSGKEPQLYLLEVSQPARVVTRPDHPALASQWSAQDRQCKSGRRVAEKGSCVTARPRLPTDERGHCRHLLTIADWPQKAVGGLVDHQLVTIPAVCPICA